MGARVVRECDNCGKEVGTVWLILGVDGDQNATIGDFADMPVSPTEEPKIFCKTLCLATFIGKDKIRGITKRN